jgi:hypothetical protein
VYFEHKILVEGAPKGLIRECCFCKKKQLIVFGDTPGDQEAFENGKLSKPDKEKPAKKLGEVALWAGRIFDAKFHNFLSDDVVVLSQPAPEPLVVTETENEPEPEKEEEDSEVETQPEAESETQGDSEQPDGEDPPKKRRGRPKGSKNKPK